MDRSGDRDRDRGGRQIKRPRTSNESRQHSGSTREKEKVEEKPKPEVHHEDDKSRSVKINKKEVYEKVTKYEQDEAEAMDVDKALETYSLVISNMEENIAEVAASANEEIDEEEKEMLRIEGLNYIASMKTINRLLKLKLKSVKDEQFTKRTEVDAEHLKLQNLLYEATNLQNQVAAVQDYKSMDEKIDLVSVEQFYKEAPESISKPELTKNDPHLLRVARLEFEFVQRQKLMEHCNLLEKEKEAIAKSIEGKQAKLDSVGPLLKKVQEATLPLQEFFDLDISSRKTRNEKAKYLPPPLFVLFVQSTSYQSSSEGKRYFSVEIGGDLEAAKEPLNQEEEEDDSDNEKNQEDVEISERRALRKRSSVGLGMEDNRKRLFQTHPLWIQWNVKSKGNESVTVRFHHLTKLKIVTVKATVQSDSSDASSLNSNFSNSDAVLQELYPNDFGVTSPNPANVLTLYKFGIKDLANYLKEIGKPYKWAQQITGVEFPEQESVEPGWEAQYRHEVSCRSIEGTIKRIRRRLTNQFKLWNQLKSLESKSINIPPNVKELLPQKNSTSFVSWESIDFESYHNFGFSQEIIRRDLVSAKDMVYKAILQRGRAKMTALVAIKLDFPAFPPVFCVQLDLEGNLRDGRTDAAIRDIEKEINVYTPKEFDDSADSLLSIQLYRLMTCCDIILESDYLQGESEGPSEFNRERLLLSATAGRNLRRPFQFVNQGGGYFTQRY